MTGDERVTRIRAVPTGHTDRYGKPATSDVETPLPPALFAPASSSEPVAVGRAQVNTADTLYWRVSVPLTAADRVRVRGRVREVDGEPAVWRRAGRTVGVVVALKSTEG